MKKPSQRKETLKYYFSVEGETEQWYLKWLQDTINNTDQSVYKVSFDHRIEKDPVSRAKSLNINSETIIWHYSDRESNEDVHTKQFLETIDRLKQAQELGKDIEYRFGYSNFSFDLWIVLHKTYLGSSLHDRSQYLPHINKAYGEAFETMGKYKKKDNFHRVLSKLTLADVITAIKNAERIMQNNKDVGYKLKEYRGYEYYDENPSLMIWESIKQILSDCELI